MKKQHITHMNVNSSTQFRFDELCSSYDQVSPLTNPNTIPIGAQNRPFFSTYVPYDNKD